MAILTSSLIIASVPIAASAVRYDSAVNGNLVYTVENRMLNKKVLASSTPTGTEIVITSVLDPQVLPQFSADGTKAVWIEETSGGPGPWSIKMANTDGTNLVTVASGTSTPIPKNPSFSLDGTKLVMDYDSDLHLIDAAASQILSASNRILDSSSPAFPRSPQFIDATRIAYLGRPSNNTCNGGGIGIYVKDISDVLIGTLLANTCGGSSFKNADSFEVSPDGANVVYKVTSSPVNGISAKLAVTKTDNSGSQIDIDTGARNFSIGDAMGFSPDGAKVIYQKDSAWMVSQSDGSSVGTALALPTSAATPTGIRWVPASLNLSAAITSSVAPTSTVEATTSTIASTTTVVSTTVVAPTTTTTVPKIVAVAVKPGVSVTDTKVYVAAAPKKVSAESAITVMTPAQAKVQEIVSMTPAVCVPNDDEIVFIDTGKCVAKIMNEKTGALLRTVRTTVVEDEVSALKVGNEIAILAPIYFDGGSSDVTAKGLARLKAIKAQVSAAGSVLLVGHSGVLMGDTPANRALAKARAVSTAKSLKKIGATGPFYATSASVFDPVSKAQTQRGQNKNRRVVIILVP